MANIYDKNVMVIDTFTAALDFADAFPEGMKVQSIEWSKPTNTSHTAKVQAGGSSGPAIFDEQCTTANQSIIKYFHGEWVKSLYIPVAAGNLFASGTLIIVLADGMVGKQPS